MTSWLEVGDGLKDLPSRSLNWWHFLFSLECTHVLTVVLVGLYPAKSPHGIAPQSDCLRRYPVRGLSKACWFVSSIHRSNSLISQESGAHRPHGPRLESSLCSLACCFDSFVAGLVALARCRRQSCGPHWFFEEKFNYTVITFIHILP